MQSEPPGNAALIKAIEQLTRQLKEHPKLSVSIGSDSEDREVANFPLPGWKRIALSDRRAQGSDSITVTTGNAQDIVTPFPARIAGQIVNYGSNPCILYMAGAGRVQAGGPFASIWLSSAGGAWDFTFGVLDEKPIVWTGPVSARALTGSTTLTLAIA